MKQVRSADLTVKAFTSWRFRMGMAQSSQLGSESVTLWVLFGQCLLVTLASISLWLIPDHVHLTQKQRVTLQLEDFSLSNFNECGLALQLTYFLLLTSHSKYKLSGVDFIKNIRNVKYFIFFLIPT